MAQRGHYKDKDGTTCWYEEDGTKRWYDTSGFLHRKDGPAVECSWVRKWYIHGKLHREDGPAIEAGKCYKKWYLNGNLYSKEMFYRQLKLKAFW